MTTAQQKCAFAKIGLDTYKCANVGCGRIVRSIYGPDKIHAYCESRDARRANEERRQQRIVKADLFIVARQMIQRMVTQTQRSGKSRPIRSEPRLLLILEAFCAKKSGPCLYFTGNQCGHPQAKCSNLACAEVACGLGHFGPDV